MRIMNLKESNKKKVRGIKRKCKSMIKSIEEVTDVFPDIEINRGYWHNIYQLGRTLLIHIEHQVKLENYVFKL